MQHSKSTILQKKKRKKKTRNLLRTVIGTQYPQEMPERPPRSSEEKLHIIYLALCAFGSASFSFCPLTTLSVFLSTIKILPHL